LKVNDSDEGLNVSIGRRDRKSKLVKIK